MIRTLFVIAVLWVLPSLAWARQTGDTSRPATVIVSDTSGKIKEVTPVAVDPAVRAKDSTKRVHSPRTAAIRSAIFPGLGQIYNKKYWKLPIAWGAVGIPAYLVVDNNRWYKRVQYALVVIADGLTEDSASLSKVHPQLKSFVVSKATNSLINYRSTFRKNQDYSILFGLLFWGLNIIDATVDAHLKGFDMSEDLTLKIRPAVLPGLAPGVSFVFAFK